MVSGSKTIDSCGGDDRRQRRFLQEIRKLLLLARRKVEHFLQDKLQLLRSAFDSVAQQAKVQRLRLRRADAEIGRELLNLDGDDIENLTLDLLDGVLRHFAIGISNQIRGLMKTFGLVVPKGAGSVFERNVRDLLQGEDKLARIVVPMLRAWSDIRHQTAELSKQLAAMARDDQHCRLLMSVPGVGTVTATAFAAAVEDPANFRNSRTVGAWVGLTPRRYQSGEVDHDGHISRRGDSQLRGLLYEAAAVILNRSTDTSTLRTWALELKERLGFKRAAVALARKLAVIMHAMLGTGELFDPHGGTRATA